MALVLVVCMCSIAYESNPALAGKKIIIKTNKINDINNLVIIIPKIIISFM